MIKLTRTLLSLALCSSLSAAVWADSFIVRDIRVEGLQRISAGTVFNYLPIRVGDSVSEQSTAEALRALFKTGFFNDVRLEREGDVLVVSVTERPAISSIEVTGNKDIKTEDLLDALKQVGVAEGRVFDRSLLERVETELQRQYFARGKYAVNIETTVNPLPRNRVAINLDISEGQVARIRQINIVGNKAFSDADLLDRFELNTGGFFSFITKSDQYSKQKLGADLETLRSFYLDRGYINFNILSTQVSLTSDKKDIYITINIDEGDVYRVNQVKLAGDLVVPADELTGLVTIPEGGTFSRKAVTESASNITARLGKEGYAFANVNTIPDVNQAKKTVSLTFFVDPGKRVYVRRINMTGNTKTQDEVLRREMRQMEAAWIDTEKVKRSRTRLERLGYFRSVNVETPAVPGTTDEVDVNFSVEEQPSGNLMAGIGYSQSQGFLFSTSVTQDNFLGTGKRASFEFNNSQTNTIYRLGYVNPYYTIDGVSRAFDIYYKETDAGAANVSDYTTDSLGGSVTYGLPINEYDTVRLGLAPRHLQLKLADSPQDHQVEFVDQYGDSFDTVSLTASWAHDTRNRAIFPDRGVLQRFSAEATIPGLDLDYYTVAYHHEWYMPLGFAKNWALLLKGDLAYGDGYGNTDRLPFFENYYAGGGSSVRGYEDNSLGPRSTPGDDPTGGNFKMTGSAQIIFPLPFAEDVQSVRMSMFLDAGNVFDTYGDSDIQLSELRASAGVAMVWLSPIGALTFSLAQPLNDKAGDTTQVFQFSLGAQF